MCVFFFFFLSKELKNKVRKHAVKFAKLRADVHEYQLEQECLEELLDLHGIEHPNFSFSSDKYVKEEGMKNAEHEQDDVVFTTEEQIMLSSWLQQAVDANRSRVGRIRDQNREAAIIRQETLHHAGKRTFDLKSVGGKWLETEVSKRGLHSPPVKSTEHDDYEEFLKWRKMRK